MRMVGSMWICVQWLSVDRVLQVGSTRITREEVDMIVEAFKLDPVPKMDRDVLLVDDTTLDEDEQGDSATVEAALTKAERLCKEHQLKIPFKSAHLLLVFERLCRMSRHASTSDTAPLFSTDDYQVQMGMDITLVVSIGGVCLII